MKIEKLVIILIVVLGLNLIFTGINFFKSDGNDDMISIRESELKMKLHDADLEIEKYESLDSISTNKIKRYENFINNNVFDGSSRAFRDSARNVLNPPG